MKPIWIVGLIALLLVGGLWLVWGQIHPVVVSTPAQETSHLLSTLSLTPATVADPQTVSKPMVLTVCPQGPPACQFSKIQAAIDAATPGSSVFIQPSTYEENVALDKSLHLIGTEPGQVRIQGQQVGGKTIVLELQPANELRILIEGLTIVGLPDSKGTSTGLEIDGQGSLVLTMADSRIAHTGYGLQCNVFGQGSAEISLIYSQIASAFWGVGGNCGFQSATMRLEDVTLIGEGLGGTGVLWPFFRLPPGSTPANLTIEGSRFIGNSLGVFAIDVRNGNLSIRDSWFLNDSDMGVYIQIIEQGSAVEIQASHFIGNEIGLGTAGVGGIDTMYGKLIIENSSFIGNRRFGLLAASGNTEVRSSLFEGNGTGVSVYQAGVGDNQPAPPLLIEGNRIVNNHEWGVALYRVPCVPPDVKNPGLPPSVSALPIVIYIQGQGNEIHDNGQGDLCPTDYNWPAGFIAQTSSSP